MLTTTLLLTLAPALGDGLNWHDGDLESAVARARAADTHVLLYFWRDGSEHCGALWQETLTAPGASEAVGDMVCLAANYDDPAGGALFERFGVSVLPTLLLVAPDGAADDALQGFVDPEGFASELARVRRGEGTRRGLSARLASAAAGSEEAIETCFALAGKHLDLGDGAAHDRLIAELREVHDPDARTVIGARAHLWAAEAAVEEQLASCRCEEEESDGESGPCAREASYAQVDLKPLYAHAKRVKLGEARFEAWNSVADHEARARSLDKAVAAFVRAANDVPEAQAVAWHANVAGWALGEESRSPKLDRLALRFAEAAVDGAEALDAESELCREAYGDHPIALVQAQALTTLALAQDANGKLREAQRTAKRALERAGEHAEAFREALASVLHS